jgi:8-amino-7-oxononanoate synthase
MAHSTLSSKMSSLLSTRKANSALRILTVSPPTSKDFSSNDFLSLSTSPVLRTAYLSELTSHPDFRLGSSGSRLLDGNSLYAENLEKEIAEFHGAEAALLFNSGFDANEGFFACVPQRGDVVVYDAFIHASVHEGMRLSRAGRKIMFEHNSVLDLERVLSELARDEEVRDGERNVFVAVESLYSMDGDLCPLKEIVELVERMLPNGNGHIIVDEAHSNGIYGSQGRGVVCSLGLEDRVFARLHTFGKAIGCNGGQFQSHIQRLKLTYRSCYSLLPPDKGILDQLCSTSHLHNSNVLPLPGSHKSGVWSHERRNNRTSSFLIPHFPSVYLPYPANMAP